MEKIILDTNFLLIPGLFKVDIFTEIRRICDFSYKLYIIDRTIDELNKIIDTQPGKFKSSALLALKLIKAKNINILSTAEDKGVDELILDLIKKEEYVIATQDKALKSAIARKKIPLIVLRQKKYLVLVR